ncbi:MAG: hypothetical protein JO345_38910 [Streptosporangiaceae bacterium]|nr:hypothetical protein [Streptosporangiaceae bacterium]
MDELLHAQFGVVSRSQLLECGMTRSAIRHRIRPGGPWQVLLLGIYAADARITTERREMAARLHAGPMGVITGPYAVRRFGLKASGPTTIDVLVPEDIRRQNAGFVRLIRTSRMPEAVYRMGPIAFAAPVRAIADAVRSYTDIGDARMVICAAIKDHVCTLAELGAELANGPSRGSALLRRGLHDAARGIWSAAEGDLADLIEGSDLEKPEYNVALYAEDGTFLGIVDAWWKRAGVAAEVDSREFHFEEGDREKTMARHNLIIARRVQLMHFTPKRIKCDGDGILYELRIAIAEGKSNPPLPITSAPWRTKGAFGHARKG